MDATDKPKIKHKEASVPGTPSIGPGIEDPCWQLFCLEHGIDPALAAWSYADGPGMLNAEGHEKREDEGHRPHRDPGLFGVWNALVTRLNPAKSLEFHSEPCVAALDKELGTLRAQGVWNEDEVREWRSVRGQSGKDGKDDLVGKLFAIMGEKNDEDGVLPHLRKHKARIVFARTSRLRLGRRLTSCSRSSRRHPLRWVLLGQRSESQLCKGTSPKSGMRPRRTFKLESTARIGRALGCDCRGSDGRRLGLTPRGNHCTRTQ